MAKEKINHMSYFSKGNMRVACNSKIVVPFYMKYKEINCKKCMNSKAYKEWTAEIMLHMMTR